MQSPHRRQERRGGGGIGRDHGIAGAGHHSPAPTRKSAADLEREALLVSERLREVLKTQPPWSKDVENHRQRARSLFLSLLFGHPLSTKSQSLEPLWHHTTYTLISSYRALTAQLEADLPFPGKEGSKTAQDRRVGPKKNQNGGSAQGNTPQHVELRKILTRFRQVLSSEDTFYRSLISRLVSFYQLQPLARDYVTSLSIGISEHVEEGPPVNTHTAYAPDMGPEEKREKLSLVYKALVCLGDLERYREQYEDRSRKEMREGRVNVTKLAERFAKATNYYEVARSLIPHDGSAFNQLAVISTYVNDDFLCVYFYFRALAVKQAFKNIEEIMDKFLKKVFEKWVIKSQKETKDESEGEKDEVARFKADILVLSAIVFRRSGFSAVVKLQEETMESFRQLLESRQLPSETIVKLAVVVIGSHWRARQTASIAPTGSETQNRRRQEAEFIALRLVLAVYGQLLTTARDEVTEALKARASGSAVVDTADDDGELHQHISAVLRRLLPALRIMSKWLKLHLDYMNRVQQTDDVVQKAISDFWQQYTDLVISLATLFPIDQLPSLTEPLEEDADMQGFIPLARGMAMPHRTISSEALDSLGGEAAQRDFHPNEEQLMRISDIQVDAKLLAHSQSGASILSPVHQTLPLPPFATQQQLDFAAGGERPDDLASVSTETEDDPVNMAMRATLAPSSVDDDEERDQDDEEEVILWNGTRNVARPAINATPSARSAAPQPGQSTAFDLLQGLKLDSPAPSTPNASMSPHRPSLTGANSRPSSYSQTATPAQSSPGMLFGAGDGGSSIWTMTREESGRGSKRLSQPSHPSPSSNLANIWAEPSSLPPHPPAPSTGLWGNVTPPHMAGMNRGPVAPPGWPGSQVPQLPIQPQLSQQPILPPGLNWPNELASGVWGGDLGPRGPWPQQQHYQVPQWAPPGPQAKQGQGYG